ncbi:MAG: hypothetical protein ACR2GH_21905 [Pseudonocardia sp.]
MTTTPVFSEQLAARSALPGETELADHVDFQRIVVECAGRADFGRADFGRVEATRLAAALLLAVIDTMDRGTLHDDEAVALLYEVADLHPTLGRLHRSALRSARQAASTGPDATPGTDDPSAS